jgi:hypothetical protein
MKSEKKMGTKSQTTKEQSSIKDNYFPSSKSISTTNYETIKTALNICLLEYERMVREIMTGLDWHKYLIQYALAIIAGATTGIGLFPKFSQIYLIASVLLSAIGWAFVEQSYKMLIFGRYIVLKLKPKVNTLVSQIAEQENVNNTAIQDLLGFDDYFRQGDLRTALSGITALGKFGIAVLPGLGFILGYIVTMSEPFSAWTLTNKIIVIVVFIIALVPIVFGLISGPFFFRHRK